jgi:hypothetical protein
LEASADDIPKIIKKPKQRHPQSKLDQSLVSFGFARPRAEAAELCFVCSVHGCNRSFVTSEARRAHGRSHKTSLAPGVRFHKFITIVNVVCTQ